jgi:hypothetical protein
MSKEDPELQRFLTHWFSGLMKGLEGVDEPAREAILRECGRACARSYTAGVFQEARKGSADVGAFLVALTSRFPEATYELLNPHAIRVRYASCACDLVRCGLVESPLICRCSAYNLQENMECALGVPVTVGLEASILGGATSCSLLVTSTDEFDQAWDRSADDGVPGEECRSLCR